MNVLPFGLHWYGVTGNYFDGDDPAVTHAFSL